MCQPIDDLVIGMEEHIERIRKEISVFKIAQYRQIDDDA